MLRKNTVVVCNDTLVTRKFEKLEEGEEDEATKEGDRAKHKDYP